MRGLRLFIRPIEPSDRQAVESFLTAQCDGESPALPENGLLGKLLGEIVAVVGIDVTEDALKLQSIVVARELRKKWIGRAMLRELEQLGPKLDRQKIVVDNAAGAQEFFRRTGFQSEGERWVRVLS